MPSHHITYYSTSMCLGKFVPLRFTCCIRVPGMPSARAVHHLVDKKSRPQTSELRILKQAGSGSTMLLAGQQIML